VTRGERRRFEALVEEVVRPSGALPPVAATDAVAAFESWLRAAPALNRLFFRVLLRVRGHVREADELLFRLAAHCYYGDRSVMRALGYDADAVLRRAAEARR
jgi:hypothetical protein